MLIVAAAMLIGLKLVWDNDAEPRTQPILRVSPTQPNPDLPLDAGLVRAGGVN
jgi:hypothetical protein